MEEGKETKNLRLSLKVKHNSFKISSLGTGFAVPHCEYKFYSSTATLFISTDYDQTHALLWQPFIFKPPEQPTIAADS